MNQGKNAEYELRNEMEEQFLIQRLKLPMRNKSMINETNKLLTEEEEVAQKFVSITSLIIKE